jgi:hypothetical protein
MIIDALYNPPVPDWNELSNEDKAAIQEAWEIHSCPHSCGGEVLYVYEAIRDALKAREQRVFEATMAGPPPPSAMRNSE